MSMTFSVALAELQVQYDMSTQLAKSSKYYHVGDFFALFFATVQFLLAGETVKSFTYKVQNISK